MAMLLLAGCGGAPTVPEPPRRIMAFDAENDAARRHARGDLAGAARRFADAERLFMAVDDAEGVARNRRHQASSALGQAQPAEALRVLTPLPESDIEAQLLRAQAHLSLGGAGSTQHLATAASLLTTAGAACAKPCPQATSLHLLRARLALATARHGEAAIEAQSALALLGKDESAEAANAHRLLAEALLGDGKATEAEGAVMQALTIDRRLALPEKLARDWLLLGDIRKKVGGSDTATAAYTQARDIAAAAGLNDLFTAANAALARGSTR